MMKTTIPLLFLVTTYVHGWYTCDDKQFCKDIRYREFGETPFQLELNPIHLNQNAVKAGLLNTETNNRVNISVSCLEGNIFRIFSSDHDKRRFSGAEALDGDLNYFMPQFTQYPDSNLTVICGSNSAVLHASPFKIEIYRDQDLIAVANGKGKMVFNTQEEDESIALDFEFVGTERAYGLPLHAERLSLRTTGPGGIIPYRLYNVDHCCYPVDSQEPLYGAVPVLYAHGTRSSAGVFWLNAAQTFVDISNNDNSTGAYFISEAGVLDFFILTGPSLQDATRQYTKITGTASLPPYFSIAHHQSRYSYMSQNDALSVVEEFDNHNFPLDVIWLDIDYTDNFKYFTWDFVAFPRPREMQETLNSTGRKLVVIIDPHIKVEDGYFVYDIAKENGYFVHNPDGSIFEGQCWPGLSSYIDFNNPHALDWYASLYDFNTFPESTENMFLWNDMNEPVVFDQDEETMPNYLVHYDGWPHRDLHNMYGFMQTKGTWKGLMERSGNQRRPFILTRSHFAGSQRYSAIWTGDNLATWEHLRVSFPMCLSEALAGISNCGADVGGFVDNVDTELLQRWYQAGAWLPFFRQHSSKSTDRREPYLYPEDVQHVFRKALRERYSHLPFWYTTWYEHERYGDPVIRPLSYHYFEDANTLDIDDQWLVGKDILVHPVTESNVNSVSVYFPGGFDHFWFDTENNLMYMGAGYIQVQTPINYTPYFYRGGSIVTRKNNPRPSSVHMHDDPYDIYIFLDQYEEASGTLYVDDNTSFNYRNNEYMYTQFLYVRDTLYNYAIDDNADFNDNAYIGSIFVYRPPREINDIAMSMNGQDAPVKYELGENVVIMKNLNLKIRGGFSIKIV